MSAVCSAVSPVQPVSLMGSRGETVSIDFQPSRAVPRRMVICWNRRTVAVSIFVRRCEDSVVYTSVPHEDAMLDVLGAELPTYQLWLGATMFEVSFREYEVLRERLAPLGLRFRGGRS